MHAFFQQLEQLRHSNRRVSLATLVNTVGTSPRKEGAKMWVGEGGDILGAVTIGGCVDAYVIEQAEAVLVTQVPRLIEPGRVRIPVAGEKVPRNAMLIVAFGEYQALELPGS